MQIDWDGRSYDFDPTNVNVFQARMIREHCGAGLTTWGMMLADLDERAIVAAYWLMKQQAGEPVQIGTVDIQVVKFMEAMNAGRAAARDEGEAAPKADG